MASKAPSKPPETIGAVKQAFSRILDKSIDQLPFEFYERTGELVVHQNGYVPDYDKWFKIYNYVKEVGGKADQSEEDQSWYFTFPKPVQQEEKPSGLPLHLQNNLSPEEKTTEKEEIQEPVEPDEEEEYSLKDSISKVGRLYPVLVDTHGNIIDGYHRLEADPDWPKHKVEDVTDPVQLTIARIIANVCRRDISDEEKTKWLRQLAELTGWTPKKISDNLPLSYQWVIKYIPDVLKEKSWDREPILYRRIGQEDVKKEAEKTSETEDLTEKQQKPVPCELCGKPTSKPLHLKGKYYCEACTEKALSKPEPEPVEEEFEAEEPGEPELATPPLEGEEKEKKDVLDRLRRGMAAAEWVLEDKYGFDRNRGLETYKVSEIKRLVEENGPTNQFLKDLRECVDLHKRFYAAYHGQKEFTPVKEEVATENIDKIDRYVESEELKKVKPVDWEAKGTICPFCGRVMDADQYERLRKNEKVRERVGEAFKN